jgi:hypothetical protein
MRGHFAVLGPDESHLLRLARVQWGIHQLPPVKERMVGLLRRQPGASGRRIGAKNFGGEVHEHGCKIHGGEY